MAFGTPGVYVEEVAPQLTSVIQAGTGVCAFLGFTKRGPVHVPIAISNLSDFKKVFGDSYANEMGSHAVSGFFDNGGSKAYFVRQGSYNKTSGVDNGATASLTIDMEDTTTGTLKFEAGYRGEVSPGVAGNTLSVTVNPAPKFDGAVNEALTSEGSANSGTIDLSGTIGIKAGSILELYDSAATATEIHVVQKVETQSDGTHVIHLVSPLVTTFPILTTTVKTLEYDIQVLDVEGTVIETWTQVSLSNLVTHNIESVINDPDFGSQFIKVTATMGTSTGSLADAIEDNGSLLTGIVLANGTVEYTGYDKDHFEGTEDIGKGLRALDTISEVNLLSCPPNTSSSVDTWSIKATKDFQFRMLEYAKGRMDLFAILDAPAGLTPVEMKAYRQTTLGLESYWGALYYPHLKIQDPARPLVTATIVVPPSGHVAGIYSRVDGISPPRGGVSAAPAGVSEFGNVRSVIGIETMISDKQQGTLNPNGVNCIRLLDRATGGKGVFVFGARTLSGDENFKFVSTRRTMTFVEDSVRLSSQFAVFGKNGADLWGRLTLVIESFLSRFWRAGNLAGGSEAEAFFVEINGNTTSAQDINNGIIRGRIGVSLFRPAEFVVFTFTQTQDGSSVEEG